MNTVCRILREYDPPTPGVHPQAGERSGKTTSSVFPLRSLSLPLSILRIPVKDGYFLIIQANGTSDYKAKISSANLFICSPENYLYAGMFTSVSIEITVITSEPSGFVIFTNIPVFLSTHIDPISSFPVYNSYL